MMRINPLISAEELKQLENYILIEAGNSTKNRFDLKHLDGAIYLDLEENLSRQNSHPENGGRHPLPDIKDFAELLGHLGISPSSHVIIYDDKKGSNASARLWWMLSAVEHEKVQVLNGGMQSAVKAGFPISSAITSQNQTSPYPITDWILPIVNLESVKKATETGSHLIIDVRDENRYLGKVEPLDLIAGHIPTAINIPLTTNLDENGEFLAPNLLQEKYLKAFVDRTSKDVIVHCGSGVTACHTLLAIASAGLKIPSLYVGSWSEWSRNDLPMVLSEQ